MKANVPQKLKGPHMPCTLCAIWKNSTRSLSLSLRPKPFPLVCLKLKIILPRLLFPPLGGEKTQVPVSSLWVRKQLGEGRFWAAKALKGKGLDSLSLHAFLPELQPAVFLTQEKITECHIRCVVWAYILSARSLLLINQNSATMKWKIL